MVSLSINWASELSLMKFQGIPISIKEWRWLSIKMNSWLSVSFLVWQRFYSSFYCLLRWWARNHFLNIQSLYDRDLWSNLIKITRNTSFSRDITYPWLSPSYPYQLRFRMKDSLGSFWDWIPVFWAFCLTCWCNTRSHGKGKAFCYRLSSNPLFDQRCTYLSVELLLI